ncbi:hypothetical protein EYF80_032203 [Liparis tanakae]|uniref:Uncharacterized protein n=1 Tax=Liparis tanakae TaxID=230148 RepID=A0A4Z2GWE1_9TELE|nr:hypothetical protein EYF80_032203 [Liparis tanakae]
MSIPHRKSKGEGKGEMQEGSYKISVISLFLCSSSWLITLIKVHINRLNKAKRAAHCKMQGLWGCTLQAVHIGIKTSSRTEPIFLVLETAPNRFLDQTYSKSQIVNLRGRITNSACKDLTHITSEFKLKHLLREALSS